MSQLDLALLDSKEYRAYAKEVGDKLAKELLEKETDDLRSLIASHTVSIEHATQETRSADAYQKALEVKKDFDGALKNRINPLKVAVKLSAKILNNRKNG